jgi:hypothetical protein
MKFRSRIVPKGDVRRRVLLSAPAVRLSTSYFRSKHPALCASSFATRCGTAIFARRAKRMIWPPGSPSVTAAPEASPKVTKVPAGEQSARFAKLIAAARSGKLVETFPEKHEAEISIAAERLSSGISTGDVFAGSYRASAKTSYVDGLAQSFDSTGALIASLPTDARMQADFGHLVRASDGVDDPREDVETKNVTIEAWIYWSKKESDHDFHVIVGDTPVPDENTILLNTEVSGLPPENPMEPNITATRGTIKGLISQHHPEHGLFVPPVHVRITGSLFWDGEHANQHVGPEGLQPDTAWEIHPIKDLTVLSN